jgi:hypothetical protein
MILVIELDLYMLQFITLKIRNKKENDNINEISKTVVVLKET